MEDWQRMTLYTESRLEDLRQQAAIAKLTDTAKRQFNWLLVASAVLLLGLAVWLVL